MQIFIYKNLENNKHSFENLAKFSCNKDAISNFISLLQKLNKEKYFLPEMIYVHELDSIIFKTAISEINIKENISKNSDIDIIKIFSVSTRDFLHSFKRLNHQNKFFVCCFYLNNIKILDAKMKSIYITINNDILDICYSSSLNIYTAVTNSKILVYEINSNDKFSTKIDCKENDQYEINRNKDFEYSENNVIVSKTKKINKFNQLFEMNIENSTSLIMEEICNHSGQIFAGYNYDNNFISLFEVANKDGRFINNSKFMIFRLEGHENNILNVKKHEKYSKNNSILISLCKNNRIIVWNITEKVILNKINLEPSIRNLNFFIFELNNLRNDCIFLFSNEINKLKLLNIKKGTSKDLLVNNIILNYSNKFKILESNSRNNFYSVEISNDNLFSINKYSFKIKENFLC